MAGLVPAIHVVVLTRKKTWMPDTRPGVTTKKMIRVPYENQSGAFCRPSGPPVEARTDGARTKGPILYLSYGRGTAFAVPALSLWPARADYSTSNRRVAKRRHGAGAQGRLEC